MIKKRQIYIIFISLILLTGIFIVNAAVDKTKAYHPGDNIKIKVDNVEMTLQQAVNGNLLRGDHLYSSSSKINPGHNASEIWVSVNGNEKTLLNALSKFNGLCGNGILTTKYSTPNLLVYQYAKEIDITNRSGSRMSLQDAIDTGNFCYTYSWQMDVGGWGGCSTCCGGGVQYRSVDIYCRRDDGVRSNDNLCSGARLTPPATSQSCNTHGCEWHSNGGWSSSCKNSNEYPSCNKYIGNSCSNPCRTRYCARDCGPAKWNKKEIICS